jgi:hypothetical protein
MAALGGYFYIENRNLDRLKYLGLAFAVSCLMIAVNGPAYSMLMLPILFIFAGAGIDELLYRWDTIFPRNPIAKSFGMFWLGMVIVASIFYNTRAYFVAWPLAPPTHRVYSRKL